MKTLFTNIHQIVSPPSPDKVWGSDLGKLEVKINTNLLVEDGIISDFFPAGGTNPPVDEIVDCGGQVMLPAFVDPHTHIPFAGSRENEFNMRLKGRNYMDIAAEGGGIHSTVRQTREISEDDLFIQAQNQLESLIRHGTATVEMKSGYGLDTETELKQLRVIRRLQESSPVDIRATFMGAHEIPPEFRGREEMFVRLIIDEMLPAVKEQGIARYCDIFCEQGVFSLDQSRRILVRAKDLGFQLRIHADEIVALGGGGLAAELGAVSADHLMQIRSRDIEPMVQAGTVFTLLPATSFFLMADHYAPARDIINAGGILALSTDFNPGSSFTPSMPMVITLACLKMGLTIGEAINAATINPAYSLGLSHTTGSLHRGKQGDFILLDIPNYYYLVYNFGVNHLTRVVKRGRTIFSRARENGGHQI